VTSDNLLDTAPAAELTTSDALLDAFDSAEPAASRALDTAVAASDAMLPAAEVTEETADDPLLQDVRTMAAAATAAAHLIVAHRLCRAANMLTPFAFLQ